MAKKAWAITHPGVGDSGPTCPAKLAGQFQVPCAGPGNVFLRAHCMRGYGRASFRYYFHVVVQLDGSLNGLLVGLCSTLLEAIIIYRVRNQKLMVIYR